MCLFFRSIPGVNERSVSAITTGPSKMCCSAFLTSSPIQFDRVSRTSTISRQSTRRPPWNAMAISRSSSKTVAFYSPDFYLKSSIKPAVWISSNPCHRECCTQRVAALDEMTPVAHGTRATLVRTPFCLAPIDQELRSQERRFSVVRERTNISWS